jgi:hypothetical protein
MNHHILKRLVISISSLTAIAALLFVPVAAIVTTTQNSTTNITASSTTDAQKLAVNQAKGAKEIARRLVSLNELITKINTDTRLSALNKVSLIAEVNAEIDGLNNLSITIKNETVLANVRTELKNLINDYRVYALILPKVHLVITADSQLITAAKLSDLTIKLQVAITAGAAAGKDVNALQVQLSGMITKIITAQAVANTLEPVILDLKPVDYNGDHTIVKSYLDQLKASHAKLVAAAITGKNMLTAIKAL